MLHAKFQDHRTTVPEKKTFKGFTIYGRGGRLGHVTWNIYTNFGSPSQGGSTQNLALIGQAVSEKKVFENSGRATTDGRRLDGCTISLPCEPNGSGELKKLIGRPGLSYPDKCTSIERA